MALQIKWLLAGMAIVFLTAPSLWASPRFEEKSEKGASFRNEGAQAMLHSLALYILAAEILGYFEEGEGDVSELAQKYQKHPGWIPAFAKAVYDADERVLYVPLGQCVWKIFSDDRGDMQFGLLQPKDKGLEEADKMVLLQRLLQLATEAEKNRDYARSGQTIRLAGQLLYPNVKTSPHPFNTRSSPPSPRRSNFDDNL